MHGLMRLRPDARGRVHLDVVWSPSWTMLVTFCCLAAVGTWRGDGAVIGPLAAMLMGVMLWASWTVVLVAAPKVRWALVREEEG